MRISAIAAGLLALAIHSDASAQAWDMRRERDPFTDSVNATATRDFGRGRLALMVRCREGLLEAAVFPGDYVGSEEADVRFRFDRGEVHEDTWSTSTTGTGVFAWAPGEFARWLADSGTMAFEVVDFRGTPNRDEVSLAGSAAAVWPVLDACGVPRTDPRATDDTIWRRAVQSIEQLTLPNVEAVQLLLGDRGFPVAATGGRTLDTYRALTAFYLDYWRRCEAGETLSASCDTWKRSREYNANADYPAEPVDLLIEMTRGAAGKEDQAGESAPVSGGVQVITNPDWVRRPDGADLARLYPNVARTDGVTGSATMECEVLNNGNLNNCSIVAESPPGVGFGGATLQLANRFQMRPQTRDGQPVGGSRVRIPIRWEI